MMTMPRFGQNTKRGLQHNVQQVRPPYSRYRCCAPSLLFPILICRVLGSSFYLESACTRAPSLGAAALPVSLYSSFPPPPSLSPFLLRPFHPHCCFCIFHAPSSAVVSVNLFHAAVDTPARAFTARPSSARSSRMLRCVQRHCCSLSFSPLSVTPYLCHACLEHTY